MGALKIRDSRRKLRDILDHLPKDLDEYFKRVLDGVKPHYKMEMARTLLLTVFEDENYASKEVIGEIPTADLERVSQEWVAKIHERGRDLLVVNTGQHPAFLDQPVDFLHRTVRDFLKDQYYNTLQLMSKSKESPTFIPPISLCRIILFFLKKQPGFKDLSVHDSGFKDGCNRMIGLVDELLYYARESEKHEDCQESEISPVADILDEVDAVNCEIFKRADQNFRNHWTNMRDSPPQRGLDLYKEGGNHCWIALAIQAGLVKYVQGSLKKQVSQSRKEKKLKKNGRPLLDYALRPRRVMPMKLTYHSKREEPNIDREMVQLLLDFGEDPN
ncbi:hypothetical protein F52700_10352 [Fusarium sp. NRRL 52700]|nr:hypothetical protein F52700_10352 [Fusarium sp. NRRL 52700]